MRRIILSFMTVLCLCLSGKAQVYYSYAPLAAAQEQLSGLGSNKNSFVQGAVLFDPSADAALARMKGKKVVGVRCYLRDDYAQARQRRSAVQAFDRGVVVGTNTYGKGIVQSLHEYSEDGAGIQITTSSYYDALDRCPQGVGVRPDIEVALSAEYVPEKPDPSGDEQLAAAIEDIRRQIAARKAAA